MPGPTRGKTRVESAGASTEASTVAIVANTEGTIEVIAAIMHASTRKSSDVAAARSRGNGNAVANTKKKLNARATAGDLERSPFRRCTDCPRKTMSEPGMLPA